MATQEYEELPLKLQDAFNALQGLAKVRINEYTLLDYDLDGNEGFEWWHRFKGEIEECSKRLAAGYEKADWDDLRKALDKLKGMYELEQWFWLKYFFYPASDIKAHSKGPEEVDKVTREILQWCIDEMEWTLWNAQCFRTDNPAIVGYGDYYISRYLDILPAVLEYCGKTLSEELQEFLKTDVGGASEQDTWGTKDARWSALTETAIPRIRTELGLAAYEAAVSPTEMAVKPTQIEEGRGGTQARPSRKPKRATRATNIDAIKIFLRKHIISARDHAYRTENRTEIPELLPRPTQAQIAERLKVHTSTVSRAIHDKSDPEIQILWQTAANVRQVMRFKG